MSPVSITSTREDNTVHGGHAVRPTTPEDCSPDESTLPPLPPLISCPFFPPPLPSLSFFPACFEGGVSLSGVSSTSGGRSDVCERTCDCRGEGESYNASIRQHLVVSVPLVQKAEALLFGSGRCNLKLSHQMDDRASEMQTTSLSLDLLLQFHTTLLLLFSYFSQGKWLFLFLLFLALFCMNTG